MRESRLKTAMVCGLGIAAFVGALLLAVVVIRGMVWVSEKALPLLVNASAITFAVCLFVLLPLALFRRSREWAAIGYVLASYVFGALLWAFSCAVAFQFWGYAGLIIGLCIAGIGVVPVAFLAALFHAEWTLLLLLTLGVAMTFGIRFLGIRLAQSKESKTHDMSVLSVPFVPCPICPDGWLISSEHGECFDYSRRVWAFVCPDCGRPFEVRDDEIEIRNLPIDPIKERYPQLVIRRLEQTLANT